MSAKTVDQEQSMPWLAWLLFGISTAGVLATFILIATGCDDMIASGTPADRIANLGILASQYLFAAMGMVILYKHPGHHIGWLCLVIGALNFAHPGEIYGGCNAIELPATQFVFWVLYWSMPVTVVALFVLLPMLFPDGHFLSSRWRTFTLAGCTLYGLTILVVWNDTTMGGEALDNPLAFPLIPESAIAPLQTGQVLVISALCLAGIGSIALRYRRSQGVTRQQLKWLAYFLVVAFGTQLIVFELIGATVYPEIFETVAYTLIILLVFIGYPVVIGIAILCYRLYDIDIIIRRTLVYTLVTGALALVYIGSIVVLQQIFLAVTGQQSTVAIVVSTLLIAALFNPLRRRVQEFIDRRFYRRKYDAESTLVRFGAVARDEVDLDTLTSELLDAVNRTVQPTGTSLWLKERQP